MTTRDSGIIDLFAIHEQSRVPAPPLSAPPPAVSFDTGMGGDELDAFAESQRKAKTRTKMIIGGVVGALGIVSILALALGASATPEPAPAAAAAAQVAEPPPAAMPVPPPVAATPEPAPAPAPAAPPTAQAKPDYTPGTAAAAYAGSQAKKKAPRKAKGGVGGGVKLQKVQSSGTGP
jgi:hypothetical protein